MYFNAVIYVSGSGRSKFSAQILTGYMGVSGTVRRIDWLDGCKRYSTQDRLVGWV